MLMDLLRCMYVSVSLQSLLRDILSPDQWGDLKPQNIIIDSQNN